MPIARRETAEPRTAEVERAFRRWVASSLASPHELANATLRSVAERPLGRGTTPAALFEDERGRRVLFRAMHEHEIAAEELAQRVRALGKRPHLPVARRTLEIAAGDPRSGIVRPYLQDASPLPREPRDWAPLDCSYLLREHPWEWLLANLDTHAGQYLRVGPMRLAVNIDWDRSLSDLQVQRLDRFTRRPSVLIPARNRLYDAYALDRTRLRFAGLWGQVAQVAALPPAELAEAVRAYVDGAKRGDPERLVEAVLARQDALPGVFEEFLARLRDERWRWRRSRGGGGVGLRLAVAHAKDRMTRIALTEPPAAVTRRMLAAWSVLRRMRLPGVPRRTIH